jgi:hypothetical protein
MVKIGLMAIHQKITKGEIMNIFKCGAMIFIGVVLAMLIAENDLRKGVELVGILGVLLSGAISMFYALETKLERLWALEKAYTKLWNKKGEY